MDHALQRIDVRSGHLLSPRTLPNDLQSRLQRRTHGLEHRRPKAGRVFLVLLRNHRLARPAHVDSPGRERHDGVAGVKLALPHLDLEMAGVGEVLVADALQQSVGVFVDGGPQVPLTSTGAGEHDVGRAEVGDEAQREGRV